jgi:ubiquinone biosynthesis protein COQ4
MAMTETLAPPAPAAIDLRPRRQWGAALKALGRLFQDKDDTGQVFEIMRALNGDATLRSYDRLLRSVDGGRIAYERVELAPRLMDEAWLDSFADGTVGAAYRTFIRSENLSAEGLAEVSRQVGGAGQRDVPHPYAWFGRRIRDTHDIWHILSGYHRDGLGEACLVAFSYAQTGGMGWALIGFGAWVKARLAGHTLAARAIAQGYRRGKAAAWLPGEDYLTLLNEPLEAARRRLNITPASVYDSIPAALRDR